MRQTGFLKGVGVGVAVGAMIATVTMPMDKKKFMRSVPGRTIRAIGQVVESFM